jgi:hypothetical protein
MKRGAAACSFMCEGHSGEQVPATHLVLEDGAVMCEPCAVVAATAGKTAVAVTEDVAPFIRRCGRWQRRARAHAGSHPLP